MKTCRMCGTLIPDGYKECPNCHFKTSAQSNINIFTKGIKIYFILVIMITLLIFGFIIFQFINISANHSKINNNVNQNTLVK